MKNQSFILVFFSFFFTLQLAAQSDSLKYSTNMDSYSMGEKCFKEGDFSQSRQYFTQVLQSPNTERKQKKNSQHNIALTYYNEAKEVQQSMFSEKAYHCFEQALRLFLILEDKEYACATYRHLAELSSYAFNLHEQSLRQYSAAYQLAIEIQDSTSQVLTLSDMINQLEYLEKWKEKNQVIATLNHILSTSTNERLLFEAESLLGDEAVKSSHFEEAKTFYDSALKIALEDSTRKHVYWIYSKLRNMAMTQKDYEAAYSYSQHCVREYQQLYKESAIQQCIPYIMHAEICSRGNKRDECFRSADSLFRALNYGLDPMSTAQLYTYRGMWHAHFKEYEAAIRNYNIAQNIYDGTEISQIFDDQKALYGLHGRALLESHHYNEAREKYKKFIEICHHFYGPNSNESTQVLPQLAEVEKQTHHLREGAKAYEEAMRLRIKAARTDIRYMPSSVLEQHWNLISEILWQMSAYAVSCGFEQDEFTKNAYNALLFSKGLLLASEKNIASTVTELNDSLLNSTYSKLLAVRKKMTEAESKGKKAEAARLFAIFNEQERNLMLELSSHGYEPKTEEVCYEDIIRKLGKNEVVIDFTDYETRNKERKYVAYILSRNWKYPRLLPYTTQEKLDSLLQLIDGRFDRLYDPLLSNKVLNTLWEPIKKILPKTKKIFYIPSGQLHQIAFESIPLNQRQLLGDKFQFIRLSSAKEVLHYAENSYLNDFQKAILYGGLEYDMDAEEMRAQNTLYDLSNYYAVLGMKKKIKAQTSFQKIKFSKEEVIAIEEILALHNIEVQTFQGKSGTEESFLSLSGKAPQLLQLSTHGFYYTPEEALSTVGLSGYKDMMYLTGLVMSGGNAEWQGKILPDGVQGGLLTSADISRMNLNNVQLAVLSACETGRGKATNEGLYGLQRAFKKAGAQTLILSLWQVSDRATKDFMVDFYHELALCKWNKRKAFQRAKNKFRKKYQEPAYWAGFVIVD